MIVILEYIAREKCFHPPIFHMFAASIGPRTMEHRHRAAMAKDGHSFYRRAGELEGLVNVAHASSDLLVWQSSQARDEATTSTLNRLTTRPHAETYDYSHAWTISNTARSATSPFIAARHSQAQRRRLQFEVADPLGGTLAKPRSAAAMHATAEMSGTGLRTTSAAKTQGRGDGDGGGGGGSAVSRTTSMASGTVSGSGSKAAERIRRATHEKLLEFERKQHQKMNFQDWTKAELIELIKAEGLEVPGEMIWDNDASEMRKEVCPKHVYVDYCKRKLFEAEPKPLVRAGKRLRVRESYCVIDIFRAAHGAVRVQAYDDQVTTPSHIDSASSNLQSAFFFFLSANRVFAEMPVLLANVLPQHSRVQAVQSGRG